MNNTYSLLLDNNSNTTVTFDLFLVTIQLYDKISFLHYTQGRREPAMEVNNLINFLS